MVNGYCNISKELTDIIVEKYKENSTGTFTFNIDEKFYHELKEKVLSGKPIYASISEGGLYAILPFVSVYAPGNQGSGVVMKNHMITFIITNEGFVTLKFTSLI